jgi:pyrroloquinoline quinone (PQQ) biosynthesis protein C
MIDVRSAVEAALATDAIPFSVAAAAEALEAVTLAAHEKNSADARATYLACVYALEDGCYSRDSRTAVLRQYLVRRAYDIEERYLPRVQLKTLLPMDEFIATARGGLSQLAKDVYLTPGAQQPSPMLKFLFEGSPSFAQVGIWIRHNWLISRQFNKLLSIQACHLDIEIAGALFANLVEEAGFEPKGPAHIILLRRMVQHFGIDLNVEATTPEAHAYLSNRFRCVRHPDRAWGLGVLWAFEAVTSAKHEQSYRMMRKLGVAPEIAEFYRVHIEADERHSESFVDIVKGYVQTQEQQESFLTSLATHTRLRRAYFEQIWEEIRRAGPT